MIQHKWEGGAPVIKSIKHILYICDVNYYRCESYTQNKLTI